MRNKSIILIIRAVAIITLVTALQGLTPGHIRSLWWTFTSLLRGQTWPGFTWWIVVLMVIVELILVLKIVSASGLFRLRPWARKFSIVVLSGDFIARLSGIINFWYHASRQPGPPLLPHEAERVRVVTDYVSMWPTTIIAVISLLSIIILRPKTVRSVFSKFSVSGPEDSCA